MKQSILVVDDQWLVLDLLDAILRGYGYDVHVAFGANSALQESRAFDFDLVILDAHLSGASGWDLLAVLRGECPERPVIMMSGDERVSEYPDADGSRAPFEVLEKPFRMCVLQETVERALKQRDAQRA